MISQGLEDFLTYLRETEQQMHMAAQSEQEANDATQDILHRLELCDIDGETAETLALKLQAVRRQRRKAKDVLDQAILISEWMESHRPMVKELERLLGEVRKQDQINNPAGGRNGQADLAMENLLGHGETRTKEGRERGQEWIMKRFCRIE